MKYQELIKKIKAQDLNAVYLFTGPERHIAAMMEESLIQSIIPEGLEQINVMRFEDKEADIADITGICRQLPMMSPYRVVVVREETGIPHTADNTIIQNFCDYLKDPEPTTLLILYDSKPDKRKKIYKCLKQQAAIVSFDKLNQIELEKWIGRRFHQAGKKTTQRVINRFLEKTRYLTNESQNMEMVDHEIEKLTHYVGEKEMITQDDLEATLPPTIDDNIFRMIDCAVTGKMDQAMLMLKNFYLEGESPFGVFALLAGQIRTMTMVRILSERRELPSVIAKKVSRPPYVVKKMVANSHHFKMAKLYQLIMTLGDLDMAMKNGEIDPELGLERLMWGINEQ